MTELTEKMKEADVLCQEDSVYWAKHRELRIDGRRFDTDGRSYQFEMMRPVTADGKVKTFEVIRKGSQIGVTICKVVEICHGAYYGVYPQGIIYYFPSMVSVSRFSMGRFKPFVQDNAIVRKAIKGKPDAVGLRRIGKVNVHFLGGSATSHVAGEKKDSAAVRSTPADWCLLDERDLFDDEMAMQVNQRLGNSKINRRTDLGTPTIPDFGVDLLYKKSDMRRWQIKCDECEKYTCLETEFPKCIRHDSFGKAYIGCIKCGHILDRAHGNWEPDYPDRDIVGYWASQLLNPNRNLDLVLREREDPKAYATNIAEFNRTVLGKPYVSSKDALTVPEVLALCGLDETAYTHQGPCAIGVDVHPDALYVVIGHRIDNKRYKIIRMDCLPVKGDWGPLYALGNRFGITSGVIDAMPETNMARTFQSNAGYCVNLCYYSEHLKTFDSWSDDGIVTVRRTDIFDESHLLVKEQRLEIPQLCEDVKTFAYQLTQSVKIEEKDKRTGDRVYRYLARGDKEDHYRNALNYFFLACRKVGVPDSFLNRKKPVMQDMAYSLG